ncbi:MAG: hypothetical protein WBG19_06630 [Thermoplasmata archaeon]
MENAPPTASSQTLFLDEPEGALFPKVSWLTPRRLALFLLFWITIFFAGSIFVNNPFTGFGNSSNWNPGFGSPNYYWLVMYLHGLNTGLVGLAALVACDVFELPSVHVRKGILAGVLIAGVLSPIGALFNTSSPWTNAGLWVQIVAFLALDEICILFLWGMLSVWRDGAPRSRTFPFITATITGVAMLFAALMGHLAGVILGFGDNPSLLGQYASLEMGESLNQWAQSLIGAHSYLMITAVPAGIMSLVAVRFGYYRLTGLTKVLAQIGFALVCIDLVVQTGMSLLLGFSNWPGSLPPQISALPGFPSFLAVNDLSNFVFLIVGGLLLLGTLIIGTGRVHGWGSRAGLPLRALPLLMLVIFTVLTFFTEPTNGTLAGTAPQAWLRLFVAFYLTMLVSLAVLLTDRLLGESQRLRIGWATTGGSLLTFAGALVYVLATSPAGGLLAAAGIVVLGASFVTTSWWGFYKIPGESQPA